MEQELYKPRSLSSCIKTAYDIVLNNTRTIIRKTWIAAIINAAIVSLLPVVYSPTPIGLTLTIAVAILAVVSNALLFSKLITLLNGKKLSRNIKRMLSMSGVVCLCVLLAITIAIFTSIFVAQWAISSSSSTPLAYAYIVLGVLMIVFAILLIPASYSSMNYLYNDNSSLASIFGHPYAIGFRTLGFMFLVHFMLGIIMAILFIPLFAIPTTLAIADISNAASMSLGDADGLPTGFIPMYYISTFVSWLLMSYVCLWGHIVVYLAYGSVTYKISNKNAQTQNNENE